MRKKNILDLASKKNEYTIVSNFGFEKKIDRNPVFSMKNVAKKFVNSLFRRQFCYALFQIFEFETYL